jgi:hypothetical protein
MASKENRTGDSQRPAGSRGTMWARFVPGKRAFGKIFRFSNQTGMESPLPVCGDCEVIFVCLTKIDQIFLKILDLVQIN